MLHVQKLTPCLWFDDRIDDAIFREKQLKKWNRQWKINLIESGNPHWTDLAVGLGLPPLAPVKAPDGP